MSENETKKLADKFFKGVEVDTEVQQAVRKALFEHKQKKNPVAIWDGKQIVLVMADELLKGLEEAG